MLNISEDYELAPPTFPINSTPKYNFSYSARKQECIEKSFSAEKSSDTFSNMTPAASAPFQYSDVVYKKNCVSTKTLQI